MNKRSRQEKTSKTGSRQLKERPQYGFSPFGSDAPIVKAKPFIKWAGGKWQLMSVFARHFPPMESVRRYYEPFLGGAAVFFHLQPEKAILSDSNHDLVELYQVVRDDFDSLAAALHTHTNTEQHFYRTRDEYRPEEMTPAQRAARFIYLNKTCYNGLYRVNSRGLFNVPFGRYSSPKICDIEGLHAAHLALQRADIVEADFEAAVKYAASKDFIYFDPPYQPISRTSSFTAYTASRFDEAEQSRLASVVRKLSERGCFVMLSNSNSPLIRELYADFAINEVLASRAINSKADGRGKIVELLIKNY